MKTPSRRGRAPRGRQPTAPARVKRRVGRALVEERATRLIVAVPRFLRRWSLAARLEGRAVTLLKAPLAKPLLVRKSPRRTPSWAVARVRVIAPQTARCGSSGRTAGGGPRGALTRPAAAPQLLARPGAPLRLRGPSVARAAHGASTPRTAGEARVVAGASADLVLSAVEPGTARPSRVARAS